MGTIHISPHERLKKYALKDIDELYNDFHIKEGGLTQEQIEQMRKQHGSNHVGYSLQVHSFFQRIKRAFINPFSVILFVLAIVSFITDVCLKSNSAAPTRKPTSRMRFKWGECEMELDQATEQFYEKLSERLKEKGFSTRIIEDGCLEVTSEKIRGKQKTHCAVGRDGEVYCHSEDLANIARNRDLNTVLEAVNDLYPQTEHSNAPSPQSVPPVRWIRGAEAVPSPVPARPFGADAPGFGRP